MRGAVLYAPHDIRIDELPGPRIVEAPDAIIRLSVTCVCGSDLLPHRGSEAVEGPAPMGHEYVGIIEDVVGGGHDHQSGPVRDRIVLRVRQHV